MAETQPEISEATKVDETKATEEVLPDADETKSGPKTDVKVDEEESIYSKQLQNQVSVARNNPLSFYVDRSRRILRNDETLIVKGRGNTISMACTLVEVLKRQKIAVIKAVNTGMDIQSYFIGSETRWTNPSPIIKFELGRGEFATCVSDYHQRKVIEIFEKNPTTKVTGVLSVEELNKFELATKFKANDEQKTEAEAFLSKLKGNNEEIDLPNFIKYTSILIHPLLKDRVFKDILKTSFGIDDDQKKSDDTDDANEAKDEDTIDVD
eukprot:CAMPEP_0114657936 /NCGR_PEP_ID=MMETSP0191-20121206/14837_1 /TAXON_ID=126664 /ORGANISM="Sorites sp." /LENGTH=266 /DNA_ID=CAMNT_0001878639 /DNA_START=96 /DNA_END=896 /DNA_ORIENTATION=+